MALHGMMALHAVTYLPASQDAGNRIGLEPVIF
jgi:hypothetical protein